MRRIGVERGVRGYFAVMYDGDGPTHTGIGSYDTPEGARGEARDWSMAEGVPTDFDMAFNADAARLRARGK